MPLFPVICLSPQVELSNEDYGSDLATVKSLSKSHSVLETVLQAQVWSRGIRTLGRGTLGHERVFEDYRENKNI